MAEDEKLLSAAANYAEEEKLSAAAAKKVGEVRLTAMKAEEKLAAAVLDHRIKT